MMHVSNITRERATRKNHWITSIDVGVLDRDILIEHKYSDPEHTSSLPYNKQFLILRINMQFSEI